MFEQLFDRRHASARHRAAPLLNERLRFLSRLADRGVSRRVLQGYAPRLLVFIKSFALMSRSQRLISRDEIRRKTRDRRVMSLATRWLRFLHRLQEAPAVASPHAKQIKAFADYMANERGLSPVTIRQRCWLLPRFLGRLGTTNGSLRGVTSGQIDEALREMVSQRRYSRVTVRTWAGELRAFFRYAETRNWCRKGLADCIRGPRVFTQSSLPTGPSWDEVRRVLAAVEGDRPVDVRDRAILLLLAVYALRAGEVKRLRLEDLDWDRELLTVTSSKSRRPRTYPLTRPVGDAIVRYLRDVRPSSPDREVFLTLHAPVRPLRDALWGIVAKRLRPVNGSLPHHGPHALRHACAAHLLAEGLSLKEIGDHLGHSDPEATRIYAKVDVAGLRLVADFDWGGLL